MFSLDYQPDDSWLHGKYDAGEIDTRLPFIAVENEDFSAQGEDAEIFIKEIHNIWLSDNCTQEEAFNEWINTHFPLD